MSNLVYLMCSLPSLRFGQTPPITMDEFTREAKSQLKAKSFSQLESVDIQQLKLNSNGGNIKEISQMFSGTKEDLSELRHAKAQGRNAKISALPKILHDKNPLERELEILKWQWEELDSIESGETFTLTEVIVYKLKLQILCRMFSFDAEKGTKKFESMINPSLNGK